MDKENDMTKQGIVNNAQHAAGIVIGRLILRFVGLRYSKTDRGSRWFSTVAANLAADGEQMQWFPYR